MVQESISFGDKLLKNMSSIKHNHSFHRNWMNECSLQYFCLGHDGIEDMGLLKCQWLPSELHF